MEITHDFVRRIDTSTDGKRFYEGVRNLEDGGEERLWCYPSVTTKIDDVFPKDAYLIRWIREQGIGGQAIFEKSAEEGTDVHVIIDKLIAGEKIATHDLSNKVKKCVQAFLDWFEEAQPKVMESEQTVVNHELKFAGTRDLLCKIGDDVYVVDYKTSNSIHDSHKIQVTAYWSCTNPKYKCALLHLGNRTKKGYSFLEFDPKGYKEKMLHFNKTFDLLNPKSEPKIKEYPEVFELKAFK